MEFSKIDSSRCFHYLTPSKAVDSAPTMFYWDSNTYADGVLTMTQDEPHWGTAVEGIAANGYYAKAYFN